MRYLLLLEFGVVSMTINCLIALIRVTNRLEKEEQCEILKSSHVSISVQILHDSFFIVIVTFSRDYYIYVSIISSTIFKQASPVGLDSRPPSRRTGSNNMPSTVDNLLNFRLIASFMRHGNKCSFTAYRIAN